jgi:RHS repeat-associated protein
MTGKTLVANGNNWTYTWDYRNRLTGVVEHASGGSVLMQGTYTYDSVNRRIGVDETVSGVQTKTWTVYDGLNVYAEFNGSGTLLQRILTGPAINQLLARTSSGGTTGWYLSDRLGSIRDIANTSGTVIDHLSYGSFGDILSESSPANGDKFKFDGMQYDDALGIYYVNARWYDPASGRFVSKDPMGFGAGDANLYRFAGNDSLNRIDPSGMESKWVWPWDPNAN